MTSRDLGAEVEQAVAGVDLASTESEAVRRRDVDAGLARHCDVVPRVLDEPHLALAEEARRVRERRDTTPEASLELRLRLGDLVRRALVVEREQVRVGDGMRLERQRAAAVERDDLIPREERRLLVRTT